jgi:Flp pilus assembly pilin Flp
MNFKNNKGQALVEYVLIIVLISAIVVGIVSLLGGYLTDKITESTCSLVNEEYVKGKKPGDGYCKEKSLDKPREEEKEEEPKKVEEPKEEETQNEEE